MPLAAGQTLSFYEILGPLGAGGMGEVWRARDTRLDREVAIKALPEHFADDEERLRRFEREARTLASLHHPNVASIFGIDQVEDTCFIAMELVRGEDLATRLARGPLAVDEALDVCKQIAEGLEAAHEAGVVHRDLKPANVCVTPDGGVKLLDFGLAKPAGPRSDGGSTSARPDSFLVTEEGMVLGTPTYMSPEQARGKPVDRRADVWAFGCVLFECLTGRRAFRGESVGDVLASVLHEEPDLASLPNATPRRIRDLLERCLRKDPRRRLRDIGEARIAIEDLAASGGDIAAPTPSPLSLRRAGTTATALLLIAALAFWAGRSVRPPADSPRYVSKPITASNALRADPDWSPTGKWIALGLMKDGSEDFYLRHESGLERLRYAGEGDESAFAFSPDDLHVAFVASARPGTPVLIAEPYSEDVDDVELELTRTNMRVFDSDSYGYALGDRPWSEDSTSLLVSRESDDGRIAVWRCGLDGGEEQITFPPTGHDDLSASYSFAYDRIVFVRRSTLNSILMLMPASGGPPSVLTDVDRGMQDPAWLPGDERILYHAERNGFRNICQVHVADGRTEQLTFLVDSWVGGLTVSPGGRIAYTASWHDTILTRLDLDTRETTALTSHAGSNVGPRFSPDGRSIAYNSDRTGDAEIYVLDLESGDDRPVIRSPAQDVYPDWSPDGRRLVFVSDRSGSSEVYVADRDGRNVEVLVAQEGVATDVSASRESMSVRWSPAGPAGELIGFLVVSDQGRDLWGIPPDGGEARLLLADVVGFDWYLDSRRVVCTLDRGRAEELVVVDLATKDTKTLWKGPHAEIDVSPDGRWVMFCKGLGHLNMGLARLELVPPDDPDGLPTAAGEPEEIVRPRGGWHVHHGGWAPHSRGVVYVHDEDRGNIYELVERR